MTILSVILPVEQNSVIFTLDVVAKTDKIKSKVCCGLSSVRAQRTVLIHHCFTSLAFVVVVY